MDFAVTLAQVVFVATAIAGGILAAWIFSNRCKHEWEIADKIVREPAVTNINHADQAGLATVIAVPELARGRVVWLFVCKKCSASRIEEAHL